VSTLDQLYEATVKLAKKQKTLSDRVEEMRPWVHRAVTSAVPASVATGFLIPAAESAFKRRALAGAAVLGGGAGLVDLALQKSNKKKRRKIVKHGGVEFVVPEYQATIRKVAAMAGDLRMNGDAGVKRPAFPTEESKSVANQSLDASQKHGKFFGSVKPKDLTKPGPSIPQVSPLPR
jgi:hypothetical protein